MTIYHFLIPIKTIVHPRTQERLYEAEDKMLKWIVEDEDKFQKELDLHAALNNMGNDSILEDSAQQTVDNVAGYIKFWKMRSTAHTDISIHHFTFTHSIDDGTLKSYILHGLTDDSFDDSLIQRSVAGL